MNPVLKKWIIIIIASIIGYAFMGLLITAVQEWIFHGVSYHKSSLPVLLTAGAGTFLSAVTGGWLAYRINSQKTKISNIIMCLFVVLETTWLVNTGRADGPLWFDIAAALSLIAGILLGCNFSLLKKSAAPIDPVL